MDSTQTSLKATNAASGMAQWAAPHSALGHSGARLKNGSELAKSKSVTWVWPELAFRLGHSDLAKGNWTCGIPRKPGRF